LELANASGPVTSPGPILKRRVVIIALNDQGKRIGETHHNARITDVVVDRIRDRHEDDGLGYKALAAEFNLSVNTIRKICTYERRAQTPERWKRVIIYGNPGRG
jgi:ribosome-binding protein aMBF1 (putative translation factor)